MHPALLRCCAVLMLLALAPVALAQPLGYAVGNDTLYRIDLANGQTTRIGAFGFAGGVPIQDVEGLALSSSGELYGVSDNLDVLLRINTSTGRATVVGALGTRGQGTGAGDNLDYGLAFTCDGRLWMASDTVRQLWEVDPASGVARAVGALGAQISGLAASGNQLVGIGVRDDSALYRIDTGAGRASEIGRLGLPTAAFDAGLDFDEQGRLWAVLDYDGDRRAELASVDPASGRASVVAQIAGTGTNDIEALAIGPPAACTALPGTLPAQPVPAGQPWALLLLMLALLALAAPALGRRPR